MREWLFSFAPLITVIYFVLFPQQLTALIYWIEGLMR